MQRLVGTVLGEGFRTFFLAAPVWAITAIGLWLVWLMGGQGMLALAPPPAEWHAHELIFGYGGAAVAGFFLTAAPSWTNGPAAARSFIAGAAALWLAGRLAVWGIAAVGPGIAAAIDLAFVPLLAAKLLVMLVRRPKPQNLMFLGLLALFWWGNLLVHLDWLGAQGPGARTGSVTGLLALGALISVLGGRVVPAFTRNALRRRRLETGLPRSFAALDASGVAAAILLTLAWALGLPGLWTAALALVAGALQTARLAFWQPLAARGDPLLWSLHLGFAMLALGYVLLGLAGFGLGTAVGALHVLGIGAVGGMTLAIMTRASLGHTGRPLAAPPLVVPAYGAMALAALLRLAAASAGSFWLPLSVMAAVLWLSAFTLFLLAFGGVLTTPRPDRPT